ncbi:MAG: malate synthase A [Bacillota bacterium]
MAAWVPADGVEIRGKVTPEFARISTPEAVGFVARLAREFEGERSRLLQMRFARQQEILAGRMPTFLPETERVRRGDWRVAPAPADLANRRVEITGPADRKMIINALNSGAEIFMADFEDANAPTWENMVQGQINLYDAVRRTIRYVAPDGREYRLAEKTAVLSVRPRGWHLDETHVWVDGRPVSGALFDFGLFAFHNARASLERGSGPYFYLPKLQSHLEARLWNRVFAFAEQELRLPPASIRATVLIEHILAAFEMEEILYELRERITGLNLGRWDYIFSFIKTFRHRSDMVLPDRRLMTVAATPFLRAASRLLVQTCHRRGAHAIGGMSAYIPRKDDPQANEAALQQVRADKEREAGEGYDGAWVAHPGLVPVVHEIFDRAFSGPNQLHVIPEGTISAADLLEVPQGPVTEDGLRNNVSVALQYLGAWMGGRGAVAIYHLMEDTATAEISRSQLWQWRHHGARLSDGHQVTAELYRAVREQELARLAASRPASEEGPVRYPEAAQLLDELVLGEAFTEFLTVPGGRYLEAERAA